MRDCAYDHPICARSKLRIDSTPSHTIQTEATTALRVTITAQRARKQSQPARTMQAVALTLRIDSNPVTRSRLKQPLHCTSQSLHNVHASSRHRLETMRAAALTLRNTQTSHTIQTEATTALRVTTTARRVRKQSQPARNDASCSTPTQDQLETSRAAMPRLGAHLFSVAGPKQPYQSCPGGT